jgi:tetratricopeptide (TPR) repeat protein
MELKLWRGTKFESSFDDVRAASLQRSNGERSDHIAALQALDNSLLLAKEIEDQTRIAELLWRKAEVFFAMGNYGEAAKLAEESLKIARRLRFANLSFLTATLWGKSLEKIARCFPAQPDSRPVAFGAVELRIAHFVCVGEE